MSLICTLEDPPVKETSPAGRSSPTPSRLQEHLRLTAKRLEDLGVRPGDCVASLLPEGPDAETARIALGALSVDHFAPLPAFDLPEDYLSQLSAVDAKLLLMHPSEHPARQAARTLNIPVANVLRHLEAGVFTLEPAVSTLRYTAPPIPSWKEELGTPLVLIAPSLSYRRVSSRLTPQHQLIGIAPPRLEDLPPPYTIEHIAAECVRILRRYRPCGPYALAGCREEALIALEMARLLDEEGDKVRFVAVMEADDLLRAPDRLLHRALALLRPRKSPVSALMASAVAQYRHRPWFGRTIRIPRNGLETNSEALAQILASELS